MELSLRFIPLGKLKDIRKHDYPQTAHASCWRLMPCAGVNIFMLKAAISHVLDNRLILNGLQNVPFWLAERHVSSPETGRFRVQNDPFRKAKRHMPKIKEISAVFSCIFASTNRRRIFINKKIHMNISRWKYNAP